MHNSDKEDTILLCAAVLLIAAFIVAGFAYSSSHLAAEAITGKRQYTYVGGRLM